MTPEAQLQQLTGFIKKRTISREKLESIRGVGIMLTEEGDQLGTDIVRLVENMLDIRHKVHGGHRDIVSKHWNRDKGDW